MSKNYKFRSLIKLSFFITLISMLFFAGCCNIQVCDSAYDLVQAEFVGFHKTELDSVIVKIIEPGSGKVLDKYKEKPYYHRTFRHDVIDLHAPIDLKLNYEFTVIPLGKSFLVKSLKTKQNTCNECYTTTDYVEVLASYSVNEFDVEFAKIYISRVYPFE